MSVGAVTCEPFVIPINDEQQLKSDATLSSPKQQWQCSLQKSTVRDVGLSRFCVRQYSDEAKANFSDHLKRWQTNHHPQKTESGFENFVLTAPGTDLHQFYYFFARLNQYDNGTTTDLIIHQVKLAQQFHTKTFDPKSLLDDMKSNENRCIVNQIIDESASLPYYFDTYHAYFFLGLIPLWLKLMDYAEARGVRIDASPLGFIADFDLLCSLEHPPIASFFEKEQFKQRAASSQKQYEAMMMPNEKCKKDPIPFSPLFFEMNHSFWQNYPPLGKIDARFSTLFHQHFIEVILPKFIHDFLFISSGKLSNLCQQTQAVTSPTPDFIPQNIRIGEELEFGKLNTNTNKFYSINTLLFSWLEHISNWCEAKRLPKTEYELHHDMKEETLTCRLGDWHLKFFEDYKRLEVNCSPYRIDQTFTINGQSYSPYELFDDIVFNHADTLGLQGVSGHKHFDIKYSMPHNPELLLRYLYSIEHHIFLIEAIGRSSRSQYCEYAQLHEDAPMWEQMLRHLAELFNASLQQGKQPKPLPFYQYAYTLKDPLSLLTVKTFNDHVTRIRVAPERRLALTETRVSQKPDGTLEFRVWHCPRSGTEMRKINELNLQWMQHLHEQMQQKKPLRYDPPKLTELTYEDIKQHFDEFCLSLGLKPEDYQCLLRNNGSPFLQES